MLLAISIGAALVWLLIVKLWESAQARRAGTGAPSIKVAGSDEAELPVGKE